MRAMPCHYGYFSLFTIIMLRATPPLRRAIIFHAIIFHYAIDEDTPATPRRRAILRCHYFCHYAIIRHIIIATPPRHYYYYYYAFAKSCFSPLLRHFSARRACFLAAAAFHIRFHTTIQHFYYYTRCQLSARHGAAMPCLPLYCCRRHCRYVFIRPIIIDIDIRLI